MADPAPSERGTRGALLDVASYDIVLDLTSGADIFSSRTEVRFCCRREGAAVVADLHAVNVRRAVLNDTELVVDDLQTEGGLRLPGLGRVNTLTVEADFPYARVGKGLNRVAADDSPVVYSWANNGGASRIFCCFDEPDLRAPTRLAVHAPAGLTCRANAPVVARPAEGEQGQWRFAATPPLAPYLLAFYAGPDRHTVSDTAIDGDPPIPLTLFSPRGSVRSSQTELIVELVRRTLGFYQHALSPYPHPKCDLVFLPSLPALAFSAPGLTLLQDRLLDADQPRPILYLACTLAHELAHAWIGGLVDLRHRQDMWLQEALATYLSRTALHDTQPGSTPWDPDTATQLPDHGYAADAAHLRQLEEMIGRSAVMAGLRAVMTRHAYNTITIDDLLRSWSQSSRQDLRPWAARTILPSARNPDGGTSA